MHFGRGIKLYKHFASPTGFCRGLKQKSRNSFSRNKRNMKIAVEGCCHGELDKIYETLAQIEKKDGIKVDLLLCCGDFQAVRNLADLECMAVPPKYRHLQSFYKYYSGQKKAPVLTIFIGGNHEASNYLQELPYGGWVAPNIYYMGYAGIIKYGGIRIGGLSGIYKANDYSRGHFERLPYTEGTKRSAYHVRNLEVFRFKQVKGDLDIMMSHDWPQGIYNYGDVNGLLRKKTFFREEIEAGTLGSPPAAQLLHELQPTYWFSAHLHCRFAAVVQHPKDLVTQGEGKVTRFLALDKCLPRRKFLQVVDIPHNRDKPLELELDPEWLSILKSTNHLLKLSPSRQFMPGPGSKERWDFTVTEEELQNLKDDFGGMFKIPENFVKTVPAHGTPNAPKKGQQPELQVNPQTTLICEMLGITDPNALFTGNASQSALDELPSFNPEEISLDTDDLTDDITDGDDLDSSIATDTSKADSSNISLYMSCREESSSNISFSAGDSNVANTANTSSMGPNPDSSNMSLNPEEVDLDSTGDENESDFKSPPEFTASTPKLGVFRTSLSLPKPALSFDTPTKGIDIEMNEKSGSESDRPKELLPVNLSKSESNGSPAVKKFKRRNQSLYESKDDADS